MKRVFLLALLGFVSCKKDQEIKQVKKDILGSWEIEKFVGYPFTQPVYPPGNGQIIVIGADRRFERKRHDTLVFQGNYFLQRKKDCSERNMDIIFWTTESSSSDYRYIDVEEGKLTLSTPSCWQDGGTAYYRRIE